MMLQHLAEEGIKQQQRGEILLFLSSIHTKHLLEERNHSIQENEVIEINFSAWMPLLTEGPGEIPVEDLSSLPTCTK